MSKTDSMRLAIAATIAAMIEYADRDIADVAREAQLEADELRLLMSSEVEPTARTLWLIARASDFALWQAADVAQVVASLGPSTIREALVQARKYAAQVKD